MLRIDVWPPETGEAHSIHVDSSRALVGRATFADVRIPYPIVSSRHLEVERRDGRWYVRDVGSSNGTDLDGRRLAPGEWERVTDGMKLHIVDLEVSFVIVDDLGAGLTLAESGSLVRKLVLAAAEVPGSESAFIEVVEGPGTGDRVTLHDDLISLTVGNGHESLARLERSVSFGRDGEWFTVEEGADQINGEQPPSPAILRSGDRIAVDGAVLLFWDPLQDMLDELEPPQSEDAPVDESEEAENPLLAGEQERMETEPQESVEGPALVPSVATPTDKTTEHALEADPPVGARPKKAERGLGLVEGALVAFSLAAFGAAIAIWWWFFG